MSEGGGAVGRRGGRSEPRRLPLRRGTRTATVSRPLSLGVVIGKHEVSGEAAAAAVQQSAARANTEDSGSEAVGGGVAPAPVPEPARSVPYLAVVAMATGWWAAGRHLIPAPGGHVG